ncbi:MAG: type IV pilus modification protein PilV [Xanthomonadaceae bacterium]|nr:type IV pilus modification protein PilV [Xanthomonadaceae bacterium]
MPHRALRSRRAQRGVGMVEVLVAVLILAIGLLGIAALQATALKNSLSAMERSQGVVHAYAILDSMRANPAAARAGDYNLGMTCAPPAAGTLAENDRRNWIAIMQRDLGASACGSINCVVDACTVVVQWDDTRATGGIVNQSFTTTSRI